MDILIYCISCLVVVVSSIVVVVIASKAKKLSKTAEIIYELLPHLDCKQCGRENCISFASDLSTGKTSPSVCPFLKRKNFIKIRQVLKRERLVRFNNVAFVKCKGGCSCNKKFEYFGDDTCASLNLKHSGDKFCPFACLGCGDCIKSCKYDAISISKKGCAIVDNEKCVGCGECLHACPNKLIEMIPHKKFVEVVCKNSIEDSEITRNCSVACTHCEACIVACPVGAISMVGNIPKIDHKKCVRCGKCVAACPTHVISRI